MDLKVHSLMREAALPMRGELPERLVKSCQKNPWLKRGGIDFEPEGFCCEHDHPYYLERYDDLAMLKEFFAWGNWGIRAAVQYKDLIFVNQVNGGDEWWTLKIDGDELVPFESITFGCLIEQGLFEIYIRRMRNATVARCKALDY
jgi:hypothetical protein